MYVAISNLRDLNMNSEEGQPISRGIVTGSSENLRRLGEADDFLFDLDDTIAIYSTNFIKQSLYKSIKDHTAMLPEDQARHNASLLHEAMHDGSQQKDILSGIIDQSSIPSFWQRVTDYIHQDIQPEDISLDPRLIKFINFVVRNNFHVGIISNSTEAAGDKILSIMNDMTGIDLRDSALFLGQGEIRKPNTGALALYEQTVDYEVDRSRAAYIGNAVSDLVFAKNTGMIPVLIDYGSASLDIRKSTQGESLLNDSIVINDFASIKNHIELLRPNYRRQISFSVDRSLSLGEYLIDRKPITLEPSEDTVYFIAHQATNEVMSHVPAIWHNFHNKFAGIDRANFSFVKLPNYQHLINEASGAYLLPNMQNVADGRIIAYYNNNRVRREGAHTTNRGSLYYRQHIDELKNDPMNQINTIHSEISDTLAVVESPVIVSNYDHIAVLGIEDNLRGNLLSLYLSSINTFRDGNMNNHVMSDISDVSKSLLLMYESAVELQYCHMLGLDYDRQTIIDNIKNKLETINLYQDICTKYNLPPKIKNPEIDNPLQIAVRANYLCQQYPNTDQLIGLTSGGVKLAQVSQLLYARLHSKQTRVLVYPISIHNGLTMWSKDKTTQVNQFDIDRATNIKTVKDKHIVVCGDNSNSGQTLERTTERIKSYGAASVHFAVVEIDPTRIILHHVQQKAGAKHNIGQAAERARPIANYFHPDFIGTVGVIKILPQDNSFSKIIALDTATNI